jgi:hypothetical protein
LAGGAARKSCRGGERDRARAEALFKKEKQMREGAKAMAEYEVAQQAMRERTGPASCIAARTGCWEAVIIAAEVRDEELQHQQRH